MAKMLKIVNIMLVLVLMRVGLVEGITGEDVIAGLKVNQDKIQTLYANISMDISGMGMPVKVSQKGIMYIKALDKSRMEITYPVKQVSIKNGDVSYIKTGTDTQFRKVETGSSVQTGIDLFLAEYLSQFNLAEVSEKSKASEGRYYFAGDNGTGTHIELIYNKNQQVVEWYKIRNSTTADSGTVQKVSMEIEITQKYQKISDVNIPTEVTGKVYTSQGTMKSRVVLSEVVLNKPLDDGLFNK